MADALSAQARAEEDDLALARDAAPFYLKLSESVLRETPGHLGLAESVAAGFTQYAYAFVAFEADRIETTDVQAAARLRQRAVRLYRRAEGHAMRALERTHPGLARALAAPHRRDGRDAVLEPEQVGLAYWAAAAWAARIALSKDQPEVVADLPAATRLAALAFAQQPTHGEGALATLMGSLEAGRPGGDPELARRYFAQAEAAGRGRQAGVFVARAESLALPAGERQAFETELRRAVAVADGHPNPANLVMRERALWLLATLEERF